MVHVNVCVHDRLLLFIFKERKKGVNVSVNDDDNNDINTDVDNNTNNKQNRIGKSMKINNGFSHGISVTGHNLIQVKYF